MKLFNEKGEEINAQEFKNGSIVVARVIKPMTKEEWKAFCRNNDYTATQFKLRGITLFFCPDWVEFKGWQ